MKFEINRRYEIRDGIVYAKFGNPRKGTRTEERLGEWDFGLGQIIMPSGDAKRIAKVNKLMGEHFD